MCRCRSIGNRRGLYDAGAGCIWIQGRNHMITYNRDYFMNQIQFCTVPVIIYADILVGHDVI